MIKHDNFPFLWDVTTKMMTMMPTTVSYEQQFSRLRHNFHDNMAKETSIAFIYMSQNITVFRFDENNNSDEQ